jgi:hypothetical protein
VALIVCDDIPQREIDVSYLSNLAKWQNVLSSSFRRNIVIGLFTLMWFVGCSAVERHLTVVPESQFSWAEAKVQDKPVVQPTITIAQERKGHL